MVGHVVEVPDQQLPQEMAGMGVAVHVHMAGAVQTQMVLHL